MVNVLSFQNDQKVAVIFTGYFCARLFPLNVLFTSENILGFRSTIRSRIASICLTILSLLVTSDTSLHKITTTISWKHPKGVSQLIETAPTTNVTRTYNRVNNNDLIAEIN